ncbi:MAG: 3-ketoacyl-ACP reductase [Armatimonadetes bacterium]|nr:3-ketoacyl-ACP reductase [Armatimonadota bacterium]
MSDRPEIALVTGGTRGIGLGIARALAKEGCRLALCGVRAESEVAGALREIEGLGAEALYCRADISRTEDRWQMMEAVRSRFGRLDILVNNAGVAPSVRADILEATEESFERLIRINLQGPYFLTQSVANWMIEQQKEDAGFSGSIIYITSVSAEMASTNRGDYCMTKAALSMSARLWAARLAEFGIPVYEVRPGIIKTDMTASVQAKYDTLIAEGLLPQARWGLPEDVGKAVAMLVRGDLPYSTGAVIPVDGGLTLPRL